MTVTREQLAKIFPYAKARIDTFLGPLNSAMDEFGIDTPVRQASFLAQIGHESGQLRYVREIASGMAYEGRKDLGNTEEGDGVRFRGRGLIQITGRLNYEDCSISLYGDTRLLTTPELLEQPEDACRSAAWFWRKKNLNMLADRDDQSGICKRINGGFNGLAERLALYQVAKECIA